MKKYECLILYMPLNMSHSFSEFMLGCIYLHRCYCQLTMVISSDPSLCLFQIMPTDSAGPH